ncbi:helix-turn-helix transcriptional regulator [Kitasatospora sp. NPDC050467]|uniref:helix-turn-helix transcriptional regulator n=1 Tax=unclassified Kitasatospora TaxID=2633591 RepID=UPI0037AF09EF
MISDIELWEARTGWTFLTNHARVLVMISRDRDVRLRDMAATCGLTERVVQTIVSDLEKAGYLTHTREGRRNRYRVMPGKFFRHPAEAPHEIAGLLELLARPARQGRESADDPRPRGRRRSTVPPFRYPGLTEQRSVTWRCKGENDDLPRCPFGPDPGGSHFPHRMRPPGKPLGEVCAVNGSLSVRLVPAATNRILARVRGEIDMDVAICLRESLSARCTPAATAWISTCSP